MYCRKCGILNSDVLQTCSRCGEPLQLPLSASPIPPPSVPTYLGWAICSTILCCWPLGIPAIVYAASVNGKLAGGDYDGALHCSGLAKMWCWIAFSCGALWIAIAFAIGLFSALTS
jgi:hypothetical protein